ncbi:MAG: glycosyltransferase [Elusimicrobia bacterium]|nr:glycosyltransferase [Elusimicrobiota bacterium]
MDKSRLVEFFNESAKTRDAWRKQNWYYHKELLDFFLFVIPAKASVLEIGCSTGDLLKDLDPAAGRGIDISPEMIKRAKARHPDLAFAVDDVENLSSDGKYDYIVLQDLLGELNDVWRAFRRLRKVSTPRTRLIITSYNHLWQPLLMLAEALGLKGPQPRQNWLSLPDIENLLYLNHYEVVKKGYRFLMPFYIPLLSRFINRYLAKAPLIRNLCLIQFIIAKPLPGEPEKKEYSVSVIVPSRNEAGNIDRLIEEMPVLGKGAEIIFVDGDSDDGTVEKINEAIKKNPGKDIKLILQGGAFGKADAVRKGFEPAKGDILMILDADLTVPPEDLKKFYLALAEGKGEFINGSRLVFPMEKEAMRTLNMFGNKVFSMIFTWTLGQRIKDTLCGTKVLFKSDYERIKAGRAYFGDFDPFGDFDLLFGACKLNLKLVEMPISYKDRTYGVTKISRFRHGLLLFKMSFIAFKKLKLN